MNVPGSVSIERNRARWNKATLDGYLSVVAVGVISGIVVAYARTPIHVPGHKAILWMAPILAARLFTRTRAGAAVGSLATAITTLSLGGRIGGDISSFPLIIIAGIAVDLGVQIAEKRDASLWRRVLMLALAGAVANLICFAKRLFDPAPAAFSTGNIRDLCIAAGSHGACGFVAGLIGAGAGYGLLGLRPGEGGRPSL